MFARPIWPGNGVSVTLRSLSLPLNAILFVGMSVGAEESAHRIKLVTGVSRSPMVKGIGPVFVLTLIVWLGMGVIVGGWLTALTETVKVRVTTLLLGPPSLTVTVIVALPLPLRAGVKFRVPVGLGLV